MPTTAFPTLEEVLHLHRRILDRFGGTAGVRDPGLVESALARPRSGYYRSLSEQAASLLQSLTLNHAFVDGNKRVGFATTAVFLRMNGYRLELEANAAERFLIERVIAGRAEIEEIARWLEEAMVAAG